MTLRARVGRHAKTGAQCQNWVEDQQTVIALLNLIPALDGGAQASLAGRVVGGISSDALYNAILRFQKKYFPAQQSGFVDPGDAVLARMEALALRPTAAPKTPGQWGEFKSGSVQRALGTALADDHFLNQVKVVEILRATLRNGTVSTSELDDLQMVSDKSRSIMPRSKTMLELFVKQAKKMIEKRGPFQMGPASVRAADLVCDFLRRVGRGQWPNLDRDEIGVGLLMRLAYPGSIDQDQTNLCGPASMLFNLLRDRPGEYIGFAIHLYERGEAKMVNITIKPKEALRSFSPPSWQIAPVDWLTLASLRNSEDWFLHYDSTDGTLSGATTPMELAGWFNRARYSDVREDANLVRHQRSTANMDEASRLFSAGYRVCMLIGSNLIDIKHQAESSDIRDDHWVVLQSTIDRSGGNVKMTIFTWGDEHRQVPEKGMLPLDDFLMNYYGYVAAKP
jgi:hypothetical protein